MNDRTFKQLEISMEEALTEKAYRRQISTLINQPLKAPVRYRCTSCGSANAENIGGEMLCLDCGQDAVLIK